MKVIVKSLVLALLLAEAGAHKLRMMHKMRDNESDEIDADDQDINDGPIENENDLITYQSEFIDSGKNVRSLNKVVRSEKKRKEEQEAEEDVDNYFNYAMPMDARKKEPSVFYVAPKNPPPPHPVKFVQATTDAEARQKERELEIEPVDIQENTKLWANARAAEEKPAVRETIEVGDIETNNMNL